MTSTCCSPPRPPSRAHHSAYKQGSPVAARGARVQRPGSPRCPSLVWPEDGLPRRAARRRPGRRPALPRRIAARRSRAVARPPPASHLSPALGPDAEPAGPEVKSARWIRLAWRCGNPAWPPRLAATIDRVSVVDEGAHPPDVLVAVEADSPKQEAAEEERALPAATSPASNALRSSSENGHSAIEPDGSERSRSRNSTSTCARCKSLCTVYTLIADPTRRTHCRRRCPSRGASDPDHRSRRAARSS